MGRNDSRRMADSSPVAARPAWTVTPRTVLAMAGVYLAVLLVGYLALRQSWAMPEGNRLSHARSLFSAVNAGTLTGFYTSVPPSGFATFGQVVVLLLTLAGTLASLMIGGMAVVRIVRLPYTDGQVVRAALLAPAICIALGTIILVPSGHEPFHAVMLSASAFGNSGLHTGELPSYWSARAQLLLLPMAVLGALGLPVLMELVDALRRRRSLSTHSLTVLGMTGALYLLAMGAFLLLEWLELDAYSARRLGWSNIGMSSVTALNAQTAGFSFIPAQYFPRTMQWLLVVLMVIGASSGGTGGGLKNTTVVELCRGVRRSLKRQPGGRAFGIACAWLGVYLMIAAGTLLLLLWTEKDSTPERLVFLVVSAVSNIGLAHDKLLVVGPGLFILSGAMLLGRLAPLAILWWMARTTDDADLAVG